MGRSIVYCDKCGQLLREDDFRVGKASTSDHRSYCGNCRPATSTRSMPVLPTPSKVSTSRLPKQSGHETRRVGVISPLAGTPAAPAEAPAKSGIPLLLVGAGIGVAVIGLLFLMRSGSPSPPRVEDGGPSQSIVVAHPPPPVDKSTPEERQLEEAAR
ncbi:MAG TPA: hypothetical protein VKW04_16730, partial [Planctomycetota bacterium]|nr:hypothetical protein [Planctomycetota bacterium]